MTMYELMTLQKLPPKGVDPSEFNWDIKNGLRPSFTTNKVITIAIISTAASYVVCHCRNWHVKVTCIKFVTHDCLTTWNPNEMP